MAPGVSTRRRSTEGAWRASPPLLRRGSAFLGSAARGGWPEVARRGAASDPVSTLWGVAAPRDSTVRRSGEAVSVSAKRRGGGVYTVFTERKV
jgi:hypothetical protein